MPPVTADDLFARYFWPHYPPDVRADPQVREAAANPAGNPRLNAVLAEAAEIFAANAPGLLGIMGIPGAPGASGGPLGFDAGGVSALARALDTATRDRLLAASDPGRADNVFFNLVVHASAFVGEVIVRAYGGRWELRRPMWESVVHRRAGGAVAPFHWILKSLADDAIATAPLAYRFRVHVEQASADPEAFAVISPAARLPVLKAPTYDLIVKYLHQHLPALRDVGAGFPTPVEVAARNYASLAFDLLHDGRVLVVHGQTPGAAGGSPAVEVLWLTAEGFDHADVIPCDPGVAYFARPVTRAMVEVTVAWQGRPVTHRLTYRGHG